MSSVINFFFFLQAGRSFVARMNMEKRKLQNFNISKMLLQIECHKEREKKSLRKLHNSTVEDETFFHAHTLRLCYFISKSSQVNDVLLITNII